MVKANPFSKHTATTYALVHRPQNDPLIHDADAPSQVFTEINTSRKAPKNKIKQRGDLEEEFGFSSRDLRDNEGEAAEHGIYYDDSTYDYMQHMRDLGAGGGEATWVEAKLSNDKAKEKGKAKQSLEDALRESSLDDRSDLQSEGGMSIASRSVYSPSTTYSTVPQRSTYEQQVDVPDALAGFQPDMDPRLREVLEALDDDAYVDDEEDIFEALAGNGSEEIDEYEFEESAYLDGEDDGWESDDTTKPVKEYNTLTNVSESPLAEDSTPGFRLRETSDTTSTQTFPQATNPSTLPASDAPAPDLPSDSTWAFLKDAPLSANTNASTPLSPPSTFPIRPTKSSAPSDLASITSSALGRKKKRKGALTSDSGFSMTSSSIARTEPLNTLDARFDKIAASYMDELPEEDEDDFVNGDNMSLASGMTGMSKLTGMTSKTRKSAWATSSVAGSEAPSLVSVSANGGGAVGFDSVMDEFLGSAAGQKGRRMKKGGRSGVVQHQSGLEQLDEIRSGLGPARFSSMGGKPRGQKT